MSVQKSIKRAHASSILISFVINGLLIVALLTMIQFSEPIETPNTQIELAAPEEIDQPEDPPEIEEIELEDLENMDFTTDMDIQMEPIETQVDTPQEPIDVVAPTNVADVADLMSDIASPVTMQNMLAGRTAAGRDALIGRYGPGGGGGKYTEAAVMKALDWLASAQVKSGKNKGGWGMDASGKKPDAGYTGLALLTFLAHGETPSSAKYGEVVADGIKYLVQNQDSKGTFRPAGKHTSYGHAMATYAIAESYTMTQNPLLQEPLEKGVTVIMDGMQPNGGFAYDYKLSGKSDNSVAAWNIQAMKAARIAGAGGDRLKKAIQKGMDGMVDYSKVRDNGRTFGYKDAKGIKKIISSAGTLCLHLTGRSNSREASQSIEYIEKSLMDNDSMPQWGRPASDDWGGEINLWYYAIQALFHHNPDGPSFKKYMNAMAKALVANQAADGHWDCFTPKGEKKGPVYNTTLGALSLMVFYRHLPTNQSSNIEEYTPEAAPVEEVEEDEVEFKISML